MYPGQGRHSYSNQNQSNQQYSNNGSYGRPPPGPPPPPGGFGWGPPPGPPPPGPPPSQYNQNYSQQGYNQQSYNQNQRIQYQRPSAALPSNQSRPQSNSSSQQSYNNNNQRTSAPLPPSQNQFNHGMNYQYSQCTGQRKALIIGINYTGTKSQLRGCINDANAMRRFLIDKFGYKSEDIVILTDDQQQMVKIPTKANILRAMQWLVSEAKPNDSLVFHYSGHGGLEKNTTGSEDSGYDSCIYPIDFQTAGSIIDDVIHNIMVRPLPSGARLTAFFDSCHSGSAMDLPYVYSTKGVIKEPNMLKDVGMNGVTAIMSYAQGNISGVVSSLGSALSRVTRGDSNRQQQIAKNFSPADVIMISGSKDEQTSADTTEFGMATGAMSYAFINVMANNPNQSYISLLNNMRSALSGKYSQKPQLSASHPIDVNLKFII